MTGNVSKRRTIVSKARSFPARAGAASRSSDWLRRSTADVRLISIDERRRAMWEKVELGA